MHDTYKGKLLISTPDSSGDIFSRAVVLVIDHSESGAFGLILNKKHNGISIEIPDLLGRFLDIYDGGPVARDQFFFLIKGQEISPFVTPIKDNYYMTDDLDRVIERILNKKLALKNVKMFAGYSGWSAHQLETEIENKVWTVLNIENLNLIDTNDPLLWKKLMQALGGSFLLWANAPEDIHQN